MIIGALSRPKVKLDKSPNSFCLSASPCLPTGLPREGQEVWTDLMQRAYVMRPLRVLGLLAARGCFKGSDEAPWNASIAQEGSWIWILKLFRKGCEMGFSPSVKWSKARTPQVALKLNGGSTKILSFALELWSLQMPKMWGRKNIWCQRVSLGKWKEYSLREPGSLKK